MVQKQDQWAMDRRSFLKATGAGVLGASLCGLSSFSSCTLKEAQAAARETGETAIPTFCGIAEESIIQSHSLRFHF